MYWYKLQHSKITVLVLNSLSNVFPLAKSGAEVLKPPYKTDSSKSSGLFQLTVQSVSLISIGQMWTILFSKDSQLAQIYNSDSSTQCHTKKHCSTEIGKFCCQCTSMMITSRSTQTSPTKFNCRFDHLTYFPEHPIERM